MLRPLFIFPLRERDSILFLFYSPGIFLQVF